MSMMLIGQIGEGRTQARGAPPDVRAVRLLHRGPSEESPTVEAREKSPVRLCIGEFKVVHRIPEFVARKTIRYQTKGSPKATVSGELSTRDARRSLHDLCSIS